MAHRVINYNSECARGELLQHRHFPLELLFLKALIRVVEELRVQVVHYEVADLDHVEVELLFTAQKCILLELAPRHLEQLVEEVAEPQEVQIARLALLMEKLVANGRLSQLHDEVIDRSDAIFDLASVVSGHLVRVHLLSIWLAELGG